jgi:hypothetical protein
MLAKERVSAEASSFPQTLTNTETLPGSSDLLGLGSL